MSYLMLAKKVLKELTYNSDLHGEKSEICEKTPGWDPVEAERLVANALAAWPAHWPPGQRRRQLGELADRIDICFLASDLAGLRAAVHLFVAASTVP